MTAYHLICIWLVREVCVKDDQKSTFAQWLQEELQSRRLTQAELARRAGLAQPMIHRWLKGEWLPNANSCLKLANALSVDFEFILKKVGIEPDERPGATSASEQLMGMARRINWVEDKTRFRVTQALFHLFLEEDEASPMSNRTSGRERLIEGLRIDTV